MAKMFEYDPAKRITVGGRSWRCFLKIHGVLDAVPQALPHGAAAPFACWRAVHTGTHPTLHPAPFPCSACRPRTR